MAEWALPEVVQNPLGSAIDLWMAYPLGAFSMMSEIGWGPKVPVGSKQDQVKAISAFVPAAVIDPYTKLPVTFKTFAVKKVEQSKAISPENKQFWTQDTIPEIFPGQDFLGEYGKYIPLIAGGLIGLWLLSKIMKTGK